nr:uncharacterized protein LOC111416124 isoform X2 [Onthophagus taurus]
MVRYRTCAVKGCEDKVSSRHLFPNPEKFPETFDAWVKVCGNNDLMGMDSKELYRKKRVCNAHFTSADMFSNNLLRKNVIPSLNIPTPPQDQVLVELTEKVHEVALTSYRCIEHDYTKQMEDTPLLEDNIPSTSTQEFVSPTRKHTTSILKEVGVQREKDLSPKAQRLYRKNIQLKRGICRLKRSNLQLKRRTHVFTKAEMIKRVTDDLVPHVADFIKSQIRLSGKHPQGRRYTLNEKCLALILYKQSPQGYRLFSKLFAVPGRKTMTTMLQNIPLSVGINKEILNNLKDSITTFSSDEKICVLFDEMAI